MTRPTIDTQMQELMRGKFATDPDFVPRPETKPTRQIGLVTQVLGVSPVPDLADGFGGRPVVKPGAFRWPKPTHNDLLGIVSPGGELPEWVVPYADRPVKTENRR